MEIAKAAEWSDSAAHCDYRPPLSEPRGNGLCSSGEYMRTQSVGQYGLRLYPEERATMALYKYSNYLGQNDDAIFDQENGPGVAAPRSGIYRCMGCNSEVASNEGEPLPPQNRHQHSQSHGAISWKLIVYADHRQKS